MIPPLQFISATKRWNGTAALNGLDVTVAPGEVVALLGRSNAGKSTAVGLALGSFRPDGGAVRLCGQPAGTLGARRRIGVMLQQADLPGTAQVHDLIRLVRSYYPAPLSVEQAAKAAGLSPLLHHQIRRLSPAQHRAVQFAIAICGRPRVLILDDPVSGMDGTGRELLWAGVRTMVRNGCAVLTTARHCDEVDGVADRVCVLSGGTMVAETTVAELRAVHVVRRVVCRTRASLQALHMLPEALLIQTQPDGRLSIETGTPELLVERLVCLDPRLSELQVLHASSPQVVRIG